MVAEVVHVGVGVQVVQVAEEEGVDNGVYTW